MKIQPLLQINRHLTKHISQLPSQYACGLYYRNQRQPVFNRVHSTQSDHHRQKVVIDTSTPKIVIEKIKEGKEENIKFFWRDKVDPYIKLARWDKPIGVYLLYFPGTWSIALASIEGNVDLYTSLNTAALFLAGAGLMRGAGCTINDLWDKDIDKQVERTANRPLVSGAITDRQAVGFLALQLSLALGVLLQLNCYSIVLGASSMFFVVTYPLAKRFTNYPQIYLGATFNWGALLGYSAIQGQVEPVICLPLYTAALAWTVLYDTIYAHQDKIDDSRIGVKSTALTFGRNTKPALSAALAISLTGFSLAGHAADLGVLYYAGLLAYAGHAGRQIYTLNPDCPEDCARKFKSNAMSSMFRSTSEAANRFPMEEKVQTEFLLSETYSCDFCDSGGWTSETEVEVHKHIRHKKTLLDRFNSESETICKICLGEFQSIVELEQHIKTEHLLSSKDATHIEREVFICDYCQSLFFNKKQVLVHIVHCHYTEKSQKVECPRCNRFTPGKSIWFHYNHHNIISVATCQICFYKCKNKRVLQEHLQTHKKHLFCDICQYETRKEDLYKQHVQSKHSRQYNLPSYDIKKYFYPTNCANRLVKTSNFRGLMLSNGFRVCVLCRYISDDVKKMQNHLHEHVKGKDVVANKYVCMCGEVFLNKVLLKHHLFKLKGHHATVS
ncbi:unnamed protein product [Leptosia nina]|uniref:4-hydroxybenzoate polyprenyltransferase, mitochondrial n=1 Tax=Leptosia nina TaxID=320188 RepID=A0AAV1JZK8_9NEOP